MKQFQRNKFLFLLKMIVKHEKTLGMTNKITFEDCITR